MAAILNASVSPAQLSRLEAELGGIKNGVAIAIASGVNRTADQVKTAAVRRLQKELTLKRDSIAEVITVRKTDRNADPIAARVSFRDSPRPLYDYPHSISKAAGVKVRVRAGKPAEAYGSLAFKASVPAGEDGSHTGLFRRRSRAKHRKIIKGGKTVWSQLPIKELAGPSVTAVFSKAPGILEETMKESGQLLEKNLDSQITRVLARRNLR